MSKFQPYDKIRFRTLDALGNTLTFDGEIVEKDPSGEGMWKVKGGPGIFIVHENYIDNV